MVGVNKYTSTGKISIKPVEVEDTLEIEQIKRLNRVRRKRNSKAVKKCLKNLKNACERGENVMPYCIEAVKDLATVQEICDVYREVYGEYPDPGYY
jgi:methylmalonyl-CoA mutase N-terminal domain/subunit